MTHTLENSKMCITVDDHGAELVSIYDKENNREVLWQADPVFWKRHAPVLFPHVGKHYNNEYHYNGKTFQTHQHGFARDMDFSCVLKTDRSITHRLKANDYTKSYFPFNFSFDVTYTLEEKKLTVTWEVTNDDTHTMYFTIGGHPAFRVPILPDSKQTDYCLLFHTNSDHLNYLLLDPETGTALTETPHKLLLDHGRAFLTSDMFDKDALIFDHTQIEWVAVSHRDGSPYLSLSCKEFPNFGIWSVPGAPYVCLEPWVGRCDDFGFTGEISEKPGIITLPSAEIFHKEYTITIY